MSSWFRKGGAGADASGAGGATPGAGAPRDAVRALQDEFTTGISSADASPERLAALLMRIVEGLRGRSHDRTVPTSEAFVATVCSGMHEILRTACAGTRRHLLNELRPRPQAGSCVTVLQGGVDGAGATDDDRGAPSLGWAMLCLVEVVAAFPSNAQAIIHSELPAQFVAALRVLFLPPSTKRSRSFNLLPDEELGGDDSDDADTVDGTGTTPRAPRSSPDVLRSARSPAPPADDLWHAASP